MSRVVLLSLLTLFLMPLRVGLADPGIESFGRLPTIRSMSISPDGKHIAFVSENGDGGVLLVYELKKSGSKPKGVRLSDDIKAREVYFATNSHVVLTATETTSYFGSREKREMSGSYVFSIDDGQVRVLLNQTRDIHPSQTGLGKIVGLDAASGYAFMPAFTNRRYPKNYLYRVSLETGLGEPYSAGSKWTVDWFVSEAGEVIAREDYDKDAREYRIYSYLQGEPRLIFRQETDLPTMSIQAISDDEQSLLLVDSEKNDLGAFPMDLNNGEMGEPIFVRPGSDIKTLLTDINRKLVAVVYSRTPSYSFQDERIDKLYAQVNASFPESSIVYLGATSDLSKMLLRVSGNYNPHSFVLFDAEEVSLNALGSGYPDIKNEDLGEVEAIQYKARDGLEIPAIITWPAHTDSKAPGGNLPLLVFPHGGPESHDGIGFDWQAQYFARKGYMILQPNFRGSTGYGQEFMLAGRGKWGREMQDDVTDGVRYLIDQGYVDPQRICIMGGSYGGYSALAGGAFTPDLYRCVISFGGVSDLPEMLIYSKQKYGRKHWINSYWQEVIGDSKADRDNLKDVSPVNSAEQFKAPLLLIHGKDDTVVPLEQSQKMYKAMKKAGHSVQLVILDGEDHWLSKSETRLRMLAEIDRFLLEQNPPNE